MKPDPADEGALKEGVQGALGIFLGDTSLRHAVGETGYIRASVEIFLENGHAQWSKGGVSFERRIGLAGGRR